MMGGAATSWRHIGTGTSTEDVWLALVITFLLHLITSLGKLVPCVNVYETDLVSALTHQATRLQRLRWQVCAAQEATLCCTLGLFFN